VGRAHAPGDRPICNENRESQPRSESINVVDVLVLLLLTASLGLSGYKAFVAPITFDEAYTYLRFARQPVTGILSDYSFPNNHILHTLLVKASHSTFGDAPWALRLPAWLGGTALLLGLFALARHATPKLNGTVVIAAGFLPIVIDYNALARGYSLGAAACVWAIWVALKLDATPSARSHRRRLIGALAFGALLGLAVGFVPTYSIFATAIVVAALVARLVSRRNIAISTLARDAAALLLGAGTVIGITYARIRMEPGAWPWGYETAEACNHAFWQRALALPTGTSSYVPTAIIASLLGLSLLIAVSAAIRRQSYAKLFLPLLPINAIVVLATLEATVVSKWPFARSLLLFAPLALLPLGIESTAKHSIWRRLTRVGLGIATTALIAHSLAQFDPIHYPEWRDNASVPAAVAAIEADLAGHANFDLRIAHPWPLDVCLEYAFIRAGHQNWQLVSSDDSDAPYRILRTGEKRRADRSVIYEDKTHGIRVTRKSED